MSGSTRFCRALLAGMVAAVLALELLLQCLPVWTSLRFAASDAQTPLSRYLPRQPYVFSRGWAFDNARHGVTNAQGYANSADFRAGANVLVIGDSFIESLMLDYPATLQGRLDAALHGGVYAAASSGDGLADGLENLTHYLPQLRPRMVVLFVEASDVADLLAPASRGHSAFDVSPAGVRLRHVPYAEGAAKRWIARSALLRYLYYNLRLPEWLDGKMELFKLNLFKPARAAAAPGTDTGRSADRNAALDWYLAQVRRQADASGAAMVFLLDGDRNRLYTPAQPRPRWAADRAWFMQAARRRGLAVIDMEPVFARHWQESRERLDFLPQDGHWNGAAHALAARQVLDLLTLLARRQADGGR